MKCIATENRIVDGLCDIGNGLFFLIEFLGFIETNLEGFSVDTWVVNSV